MTTSIEIKSTHKLNFRPQHRICGYACTYNRGTLQVQGYLKLPSHIQSGWQPPDLLQCAAFAVVWDLKERKIKVFIFKQSEVLQFAESIANFRHQSVFFSVKKIWLYNEYNIGVQFEPYKALIEVRMQNQLNNFCLKISEFKW